MKYREQVSFDTSTNKEQVAFYKKLNDVLFEGDLSKPINPKAMMI